MIVNLISAWGTVGLAPPCLPHPPSPPQKKKEKQPRLRRLSLLQVKSKLKGHSKRISGLAFSNTLNVLVSSGADAQVHQRSCFIPLNLFVYKSSIVDCEGWWGAPVQVCMWSIEGYEKRKSKFLQGQGGRTIQTTGDTRVQFHNDQIRLLVVHESQLAIYDAAKFERIRQVFSHFSVQLIISLC